MKYKFVLGVIFGIILFTMIVTALTFFDVRVVDSRIVDLCYDFDGIDVNKSSSTVYSGPWYDWGYMYDYCKDDNTVVEYGCGSMLNETGNFEIFMTYEYTCFCSGGKCV